MKITLPAGAKKMIDTLYDNGFEAYVVGGCVRDSLLKKTPKDWDITTSAKPEEIIACFQKFPLVTNGLKHGTVGVVINGVLFEATTYRVDGTYSDNRRPDSVTFTADLKKDLSRRDFTINAMAYNDKDGLIDCFAGREDLKEKQIRCVSEADRRFEEDALRILRALRFASVLGFTIEEKTAQSILKLRNLLNNIARERITGELLPLLCGENAGIVLEQFCKVFAVFIPELAPMFDFDQNTPYHNLPLWEHTVKAVENIMPQIELRLAMLFHDIGKPLCKTTDAKGISHFHGHPVKSAEMADQIMQRLRLPNKLAEEVKSLIFYHDYRCNPTESAVRRLLSKAGEDTAEKLVAIRYADALAQSDYKKKEKLSLIAAYGQTLAKTLQSNACFSVKHMEIDGSDLIALGIPQGKQIGFILQSLLEEIIDGRLKNKKALLLQRAKELL